VSCCAKLTSWSPTMATALTCPKIQTRMLLNDLDPPSPYRSIDTLAIAKKEFGFTSNKLAFIAQSLGLGDKLDTGGF
jgi:hypothetical protein